MIRYADIAFPTAVRRCFTYRIPDNTVLAGIPGENITRGTANLQNQKKVPVNSNRHETSTRNDVIVKPGMRVWVPLRNQMAIGMVVRVHQNRPDFETRDIVRILDREPVLSGELLKLTEWVHRFYYSGYGEAIQAALPAGMNFIAEPRIRTGNHNLNPPKRGLEREIYDFLTDQPKGIDISLTDVSKHWQKRGERAVDRLVLKNLVEIWQIPRIRMQPQLEILWDWCQDIRDRIEHYGVLSVLSRDVTGGELTGREAAEGKDAEERDDEERTSAEKHYQNKAYKSDANEERDAGKVVNEGGVEGERITNSEANQGKRAEKQPKWIRGLQALAHLPLPATRKDILEHPDITPYVWNRLRQTGLLTSYKTSADPISSRPPFEPDPISILNEEQQKVFRPVRDAIASGTFHRFLLYGITGSGKTEIYIHALHEALKQGRGGLILVPEIALTAQTVNRFHRIFGDQVAVLHSRLSERERFDAWTSLQKGEKKVVIGARSAVFAPVQNPGLIIIDEEHDTSYKQEDPAPRYHARETAVMRAWLNNAVILTGSATPGLTSLHAAASGKCTMLRLDNRHALAELPEVKILDLKQYRYAMRGPLAVPLFLAVEEALSKKEQIILLHNRRGYSTFLQCAECGEVIECPHCSVTLTYHKSKKHLRCHYCGFSRLMPSRCPSCQSGDIGELGMGTQKVESELAEIFPDARIARMDQDTTSGKGAHEKILHRFAGGDADILMGTQIVAKGLDFPNVTVVGVINSDTELAFPSYRSSERMYQLLSQVAGRSGRGSRPGKVFLQTLMPEHAALRFAQKHDFPGFSRHEMKSRRKLNYPPYSRLVKIFFRSADPQRVAEVAELYTGMAARLLPDYHVMGPSPSTIARVKNRFSWESHLKLPPDKGALHIERMFDALFNEYEKIKPPSAGKVRITINVDTMH